MSNDSYKTFRVSVRPPRVACLIDSNDTDWQTRVLFAIESFSRTWGGAYFILVPTDGKTISNPFWQILLAYDPDYLWLTYKTNDNFEQELILSDELADKLKLRLAPFHYDGQPIQGVQKQNLLIKGGACPNYSARRPFTDILNILPNCEHPSKLAEISNLDGMMKLWAAATTGLVSSKSREELDSLDISTATFDYSNNQQELFDLIVKGKLSQDEASFPFAFSLTQLAYTRSTEFADWRESTLVVVGETLEDFCLYYCLSRMRRKVAWLLPEWLPDEIDESGSYLYNDNPLRNFARSLRDLEQYNQQDSNTCFLSISVSTEKIAEIRELFKRSHIGINVQDLLPTEDNLPPDLENPEKYLSLSLEWMLRFPFRIYEYGNIEKNVDRHVINSEIAGSFETPKPKNFSKIPSQDHYWIAEFSIIGQQFPRHPFLGKEIVINTFINSWEARTGREAVAYFSQKGMYITDDIDQSLIKPVIRLPNAITIFHKLLEKLGYKVEFSDKGLFSFRTISKFGSISSLAYFLFSNQKRAVLERYIAERPKPSKNKDEETIKDGGLFLKDGRWYLNFGAIKEILGDDNQTADLIYDLLGKSILHRGLILKCFFCRGTDWFGVSELTHEFKCKRCSSTQTYGQFHSLNTPEPPWYYKLDEIVYRAMEQKFIVPLLATYRLQDKARSFDYSPELELLNQRTREKMELDICCITDGKVTIGEAKTANRLGKSAKEENEVITKYYNLAERLGASQVIFATGSDQWRAETARLITERFSNSLTKAVFWAKEDIYSRY